MIIDVQNVQPTPKELRAVSRGWGAMHWVCIPYTYAFQIGFLIYGLAVSSFAEDAPRFLFVGCLGGSWLLWQASAWMVRRVAAHETRKTPTGGLAWDWSISSEGLTFTNGLQTNRFDWRAVKSIREEGDRFLFLVVPAYTPVLPKRLLSEPQLSGLRTLIAQVIADGRIGGGPSAGGDTVG